METLLALAAFVAFVGLLVQVEAKFVNELYGKKLKLSFDNPGKVFGKSRSPEANFTRWFR